MLSPIRDRRRRNLEEQYRRKKQLLYQTDPVSWLDERFKEPATNVKWSDWGLDYNNHKWDGTKDPFYEICEALANKEWCGVESATSTGKTFFLPRIIYWFLDVFPNSLVVTTAPKKEQLRAILWKEMNDAFPKFNRIRTYSEMITLRLSVDKRAKKKNKFGEFINDTVGHEAIGVVAGVGSAEESATKMQGFHREHMLFVIDESPGVHAAVFTAIINTCTASNNLILAVGNPDSQLDPLHQFCQLKKVRHVIISGYDHPNVVLGKEIIPGAVSRSSIEFRREQYGEDGQFFKSRVRGIAPEEGKDSLIKLRWINQCIVGHEFFDDNGIDTDSHNAVGVDVANSENGDKAALAWGRYNELLEVHEFQCPNATHLAYNIFMNEDELASKGYLDYGTSTIETYDIDPQGIGVDGVGVGTATVNALRDEGYKRVSLQGGQMVEAITEDDKGELLYNFNSLRSQMWFELREDLRTGNVRINISNKKMLDQIRKELTTPKWTTKNGKIALENKDEIKKRLGGNSPNVGDAIAYWNWTRKGYHRTGAFVSIVGGVPDDNDW